MDSRAISTEQKHAVIGAGFSGLGVAGALGRAGIPYDCLEATNEVGGNWSHGVYETVHIISSRKTTEYGDWPMPSHWPDFPSKDQMLAYLKEYAERFGIRQQIQFGVRVERVRPAPGDRWELELNDGRRVVYGGVIVANGHHWDRRMPSYPGDFDGTIIHSKDYKAPSQLAGKNVLVIGGGNSACDIAVEAARFAKSAHISMRRGYWFLPKTILGVPFVELLKPWMPVPAQRVFIRGLLRIAVGPYEKYGLQHPDHRIFERHPTINSELLHFLRHGRVTAHPDVARYEGGEAVFADGVRAPFDLVICATGYHVSFPFVEGDVVRWNDRGMPDLVSGLLPLRHRNIYFFGTGQPRYGAGPLITEGARALVALMAAQRKLDRPIGAVLADFGGRAPESWLLDPHRVLLTAKLVRKLAPGLPALEKARRAVGLRIATA